MSRNLDTIKAIGEEMKMPNLLEKILSVGRKRTEVLDGAGVASKEAIMKTDGGNEYPAKCYAYVPDKEQVSTWKLRICAVGTTDTTREQLGAAAAAFSPGGFRGNRVEIPRNDIGKVKERIRNEYSKLGVERGDMPESIKSMEVKEVENEFLGKFVEASKACAAEMRKKMDTVLSEMEKQDSDKVAMLRQLAELVAQVDNEELRASLNELVVSMQKMLQSEDESEGTQESERETENVETEDTQQPTEEKSINVDEIAKALKLDELSTLLESHQKSISEASKALPGIVESLNDLIEKNKQLTDRVNALENRTSETEKKTKELEVEDEKKVAEKQKRFSPFWGSQFQASKAAETVLDNNEAKNYAKPEVPSVIQSMSKSILGGK